MPAPSKFTPIAPHAQHTEAVWGIPSSVTLVQWALESNYGKAVTGTFNYGGQKAACDKDGQPLEPATLCWTHEVIQGKRIKMQCWFKDYPTPAAFFDSHGKLLARGRYMAQFRKALGWQPAGPHTIYTPDRIDAAVMELGGGTAKDPRYATSPRSEYGPALIKVMRQFDLYAYNRGGKLWA